LGKTLASWIFIFKVNNSRQVGDFFLESFANKRFLHRDLLVCCSFLSDGTFSDFTLKKIVLINQKEKKLKSKSINRKRQRLYKQT
jgi:hypothetical protein